MVDLQSRPAPTQPESASPRLPAVASTSSIAVSRRFRCQCGRPVFFANTRCLGCDSELGYLASVHRVIPLQPGVDVGTWQVHAATIGIADAVRGVSLRRCANFDGPSGCNWMVVDGSIDGWCESCRLNRTIPDLAWNDNALLWSRIEMAKRRLVSALLAIGLPLQSRVHDDVDHGVMFDFLRWDGSGERVLTGHADGLITLNIEEADDVRREAMRHAMHEPYRTLLGHLRHEIGHYYWELLVANGNDIDDFRALFGDERVDYAEALQSHYDHGPPADWSERHVSAYATMHPWEDWAETWAHYLHMVDASDTAGSFGLHPENVELDIEPFGRDALYWPDADDADAFLGLVNGWARLTGVLNELSRSMGQPDFYPFVLPRAVVGKLQFIDHVVRHARLASVDR